MRTFAVVSGKGGAGKTLFSIAMAHVLARRIIFGKVKEIPQTDIPVNEQTGEPESLKEIQKRREEARRKAIEEYRNRVLMVDMDLHVKGLTFLMYPDLKEVETISISTNQVLRPDHDTSENEIKEKLEALPRIQGGAISVLPAASLIQPVDWIAMQGLDVHQIIPKLGVLKRAADQIGFDFLILDTRAGPDSLSISAALVSEFAIALIEQDEVSKRAALQFSGDTEHKRREVAIFPETPDLAITRLALVRNKLVRPETREERGVLAEQSYLHGIPFDMSLLRLYSKGTFDLRGIRLLDTRFGWHAEKTVRGVLDKIQIEYQLKPAPSLAFLFRFITETVTWDVRIITVGIILLMIFALNGATSIINLLSSTANWVALSGVFLTLVGWILRRQRG